MRISVRHPLGGCRVEAESSHNLQVVENAPRAGDLCIIEISVNSKRQASNSGKTRKMDADDVCCHRPISSSDSMCLHLLCLLWCGIHKYSGPTRSWEAYRYFAAASNARTASPCVCKLTSRWLINHCRYAKTSTGTCGRGDGRCSDTSTKYNAAYRFLAATPTPAQRGRQACFSTVNISYQACTA